MIQRELYDEIKQYIESKPAIVITGMRRVGKTTLLHYIYDTVSSTNKIYLDLENPLTQKQFEYDDFEEIKRQLEVRGIDFTKRSHIFLDEIQWVRRMPNIVKYLGDHYNVKFFLTGSASFYLKNLFSESLVGRKYIFELFPCSFKEFLLLKGERIQIPDVNTGIAEPVYQLLMRHYREYVEYGGFPEVIQKNSVEEKKRAIDDIFSSYFQLEVEKLGDFRKKSALRDLIILLMERTGNLLDTSKLSRELGISRPTIYEYIAFLEGTYFIHLVHPWSKSRDVEIRKAPKVYACDSGLARHIGQTQQGALFETNVFQRLRSRSAVNYYQKKTGAEIDFIVDKSHAYEVKMTPSEHDVKRLVILSKEIGLHSYSLISYSYVALPHLVYGFQV